MGNETVYTGQIDLWSHDSRIAADRILKELGLADSITVIDRTTSWTYEILAITARQAGPVMAALKASGQPHVDWYFDVD